MPDYFTIAELRELPQMADTSKYPDARCEAASAHIVGIIEREVGTSFFPRTKVEVHDSQGIEALVLRHPFVLSVTTVKVDGVTLAGYTYRFRSGLLRRYATGSTTPAAWPSGFDNIEVTYEAGYSATPPADVKEAALSATRSYLLATALNSSLDARRTSLSTEQGTVQFTVAGSDRPTGYPDVDATIVAWRQHLGVFGFA